LSILDDLGKKIGKAADIVADKTKDVVESTKLSADIAGEERALSRIYKELGEMVFQKEKDSANSIYADKIQRIKDCLSNIEEYNRRLQELKGNSGGGVNPEDSGGEANYIDVSPPKN
jgi:sporulation protein YlmC with PRC-barrel domain